MFKTLLFVFLSELIIFSFIATYVFGQWKLAAQKQREESVKITENYYKAMVLCKNGLIDFYVLKEGYGGKCK